MNDDVDIERMLRRYRSGPGPHVRQSVLSRFTDTIRGRSHTGGAVGLWKRPIPLYVASAVLVVAVGLSFFAGKTISLPDRQRSIVNGAWEEGDSTAVQDVRWEVAPNDIL